MVNTLLMVIGGGLGTVIGPVVGAIVFTELPEFLRFSDEWRLVIYGVLLLLLIRYLPNGLWGTLVSLTASRRRGGGRRSPTGDGGTREPDDGKPFSTVPPASSQDAGSADEHA